jgi:hypothetical protein
MSFKASSVLYEGYTAKGYIEAVPRLYDELRFTYRPVQAIERQKLIASMNKLGDKHTEVTMGLVASRLVSWELKDDQGKDYPIGKESVMLLQPQLWVKLSNIVLGFDASDADPTWSSAESEQFDADALEAELTGKPVAQAQEDARLKN